MDSVAVAVAYELKPEMVLSTVRRYFISAYCSVVVAANWSRAAPMFVAAAEMLSKWPLNWANMSSGEAGPQPVVGLVGKAAVILWASIVRLADPNYSPLWEESRSSLSIAIWRGGNLSFRAVQVWAEGMILSQARRSLGNEFADRKTEVAIAASQSLVIGREL